MEWKKNTSSWSGFAFIARKTHPSCVGSVFPCQLITAVQQRRASCHSPPCYSRPWSGANSFLKVILTLWSRSSFVLTGQQVELWLFRIRLHYIISHLLMLQVTVCCYFHFDTKDLQLYVLRPSPHSLVFLSPSTCGWFSMLCSWLPLRMSVFQVLLTASY